MSTLLPIRRFSTSRLLFILALLARWPAVACLVIACTGSAWGQWEQLHKLTAEDAAEYARFGNSVSISGSIIVVGAPFDYLARGQSGSAYVFDAISGQQLHKLTADDVANGDRFGNSVSVSGSAIVVGADGDDDAGTESGSAYVFDATTGQQLLKLTADDAAAYDNFGHAVSISGDTVVVGAHWDGDAGYGSGSGYVFDATTGEQLHKLTADDGEEMNWFGFSVSVSDRTIVVGAYKADDDSGSAYVFNGTSGQQLYKLTAYDGAEWKWFGLSVSVTSSTIVVGAPNDYVAGYGSGSAYVFKESALCPADINDDGFVDSADILVVLGAWGTCDDCPEDINDDGKVNIDDVFEILGQWGPCP